MKKKQRKKNKGIVHSGDRILWTPTWKGGSNGKKWYKRVQEIQKTIDTRIVATTPKITKRRAQQDNIV